MEEKKSPQGITLIALVVTIIVLLILSGVAIQLSLGNNGLFTRTKQGATIHEEAEAKEKLEMGLGKLSIDKQINPEYNDEYMDIELAKQGIVMIGNIAIVDGWQFEIDRTVLKILTNIGKGEENEDIQIKTEEIKLREDYVVATLKVGIEYEGIISKIIINGEEIDIPNKENGIYNIEKIVEENGTYTILAKDEDENYKIEKVEVTEITEDMEIYDKKTMEEFRDKVNSGRTFEGRTAKLIDNIDLGGNNWISIASSSNLFKGTFEGNNKIVKGLYIDSTEESQGLFKQNNGTIKNVIIEDGNVKSTKANVGLLVGSNLGEIYNIKTSGKVNGAENVGGVIGNNSTTKNVEYCENNASITYNKGTTNFGFRIGGVIGSSSGGGKVKRCINRGSVTGAHTSGGIIGLEGNGEVNECINYGTVTGAENSGGLWVGGIVGAAGWVSRAEIRNCINLGEITSKNTVQGRRWNSWIYSRWW